VSGLLSCVGVRHGSRGRAVGGVIYRGLVAHPAVDAGCVAGGRRPLIVLAVALLAVDELAARR
jgi:hypothetical protein